MRRFNGLLSLELMYSHRQLGWDGVQGWNPWLGATPPPPF